MESPLVTPLATRDRLERAVGHHDTPNQKKETVCVSFDWEKLLRFMERKHFKVHAVSDATGITPRKLSEYRHGRADPNKSDKWKLCKALGVKETFFDKAR